jgi:ubiquinone/menaquinone biosynthesis C-methylase UbiE
MIDNKYIDMVNNNKYLTSCQKKEFTYFRSNIDTTYIGRNSNKQFSTLIHNNINKFEHVGKLSQLLYHFCNDTIIVNKVIKKLTKHKFMTDKRILKYIVRKINSHAGENKYVENKMVCNKWDYIFQNLFLKYMTLNINISNLTYLDYGCGNGSKTNKFANNFKINKNNIHGTDIENWGPYTQMKIKHPFNFKYILKNGKIDFPDNKFDIVTCFFVLHHIETLDTTLKELKRIIKPNGILLLLDHNALTDSDRLLLDIEHLLYEIIYSKNYEYLNTPFYAKYYNYMEWDYIFNKYKFDYITSHFLFQNISNEIRYDNAYYAFYKNIKF